MTDQEIERQNAKSKEYHERKKKYMKFDFAEYVSRDEFLDPSQYDIQAPKQLSKREYSGIEAI